MEARASLPIMLGHSGFEWIRLGRHGLAGAFGDIGPGLLLISGASLVPKLGARPIPLAARFESGVQHDMHGRARATSAPQCRGASQAGAGSEHSTVDYPAGRAELSTTAGRIDGQALLAAIGRAGYLSTAVSKGDAPAAACLVHR